MKHIQKILVLSLMCCLVTAVKQYESDPIAQTVHYDDDESENNSPYPQITDPKPNSFHNPANLHETHQYTIPTAPVPYRRAAVYRHQPQPELFGYYTSPRGPYDSYSNVQSPVEESKYTSPPSTSPKLHNEAIEDRSYKKSQTANIEYREYKQPLSVAKDKSGELQHSQESDEYDQNISPPTSYLGQKYGAETDEHSHYPVPASPHPPSPKRDPKLPLYFTMYEKRIVQDPLDKYGKGPWRYLTYGHGITYGSKEPGKVFEKGYGYIRALGRDHCKLPESLCPKTDEKPFEYDGRKEPYFGYRPH